MILSYGIKRAVWRCSGSHLKDAIFIRVLLLIHPLPALAMPNSIILFHYSTISISHYDGLVVPWYTRSPNNRQSRWSYRVFLRKQSPKERMEVRIPISKCRHGSRIKWWPSQAKVLTPPSNTYHRIFARIVIPSSCARRDRPEKGHSSEGESLTICKPKMMQYQW